MTYAVGGKIVETIGAVLIAFVAVRAFWLEYRIGRHVTGDRHPPADADVLAEPQPGAHVPPEAASVLAEHNESPTARRNLELADIGRDLRHLYEHRKKLFGFRESIIVGSGSVLIVAGCVLYLMGLISEHSPHELIAARARPRPCSTANDPPVPEELSRNPPCVSVEKRRSFLGKAAFFYAPGIVSRAIFGHDCPPTSRSGSRRVHFKIRNRVSA
jgi:hypothetical protein